MAMAGSASSALALLESRLAESWSAKDAGITICMRVDRMQGAQVSKRTTVNITFAGISSSHSSTTTRRHLVDTTIQIPGAFLLDLAADMREESRRMCIACSVATSTPEEVALELSTKALSSREMVARVIGKLCERLDEVARHFQVASSIFMKP